MPTSTAENLSGGDLFFKPNTRLAESPPSLIRAIALTRHEGHFTRIGLNLGELDFPIPAKAREANASAVEGKILYTPNAGLDSVRAAVAENFSGRHGVSVEKDNIIVTAGSTGALYVTFETFLNPGDEVLVPSLHYPLYRTLPEKWGAKVIEFALTDTFDVDVKDLVGKVTPNTKLVVLNSPSNPTGQLTSPATMEELAYVTSGHDQLFFVSDEIYSTCIFGGEQHYTMASFTDRTVVIDGLSKRASATGKRLGWMIAPKSVVRIAEKSQQQAYVCAPTDSQYAALPILTGECDDDLAQYQRELSERRELMRQLLHQIPGIKFLDPKGAFYYFVDVSSFGDSMTVARRLIEEVNVVTTPGQAFGDTGKNYLRLSYAGNPQVATEALERMKGVFQKWQE